MKHIIFAFVSFTLLWSCAPKEQTITGELTNLPDGEVTLEKYNPKGNEAIATVPVAEGVFTITYTPEQTDLYMLKTDKKSIPFFLDQNSVTITGDMDGTEEVIVAGSVAQDEFKAHNDAFKPLTEKEQDIILAYRTAQAAGDEVKMDSAGQAYQDLQEEKTALVEQHLADHPASNVSAFLARMTFGHESDVEKLKSIVETLDGSLEGYAYYDFLVERVEKLDGVAEGKIAPDFELNDPEGNPMKLSSLRGKYVLMDFWASWCGPCRAENPNVVKLYKKYSGDQFDIIGISLDNNKEKWLQAIEADGLAWNHVSDLKGWKSMAADLYAVSGIPHTILLDPDGKIIAKNLRGEELANKLAELLD